MNENTIAIPYEEYRNLLTAEIHLSFIMTVADKAKYSSDVKEAIDLVRSLRNPDVKVDDDAE